MCAFLAQNFAELLAILLKTPQTGSRPINGDYVRIRANAYDFSLPECPCSPGTQQRWTSVFSATYGVPSNNPILFLNRIGMRL